VPQRRIGFDLAQNFQAIDPWHFQVEQNDARQAIRPAGEIAR
jgi:hypothetical protein